jgi:ferrous iron transport protein B
MAYTREPFLVDYGRELENEISKLQTLIEANSTLVQHYGPRWLAIKLLEDDSDVVTRVKQTEEQNLLAEVQNSIAHLQVVYGDDVETVIADRRYGWIHGLVKETVRRRSTDRRMLSDKIDSIVTNRVLGIPIFLVTMWAMFKIITDVVGPYVDWVDGVIGGPLSNWVIAVLNLLGLGGTWVESLLMDGIIAGVGGVLVFVPILLALYFALGILEDSGYMARAAFVMDRLMHAVGLHGKSFLPMIIGFGCTVPAFYATRTLESERDRVLTGLLVPFMSCGARLPVYVLFAAIFFPDHMGRVIFLLYLTGIVIAILLGMVLKRSLFRGGQQSPFVLELPPYRLPTLRGIWFNMSERSGAFVRKAGTIIVATSVVIWILLAIPIGGGAAFADADIDESAFAAASGIIAPVLAPLGFGDWQASGALITGFIAKEVVVSTMAQLYGTEEAEEEAEPTTFLQDVGEIVTSFIGATVDVIKSIPLIVGINLFEGEEEAEPTDLMKAVEDGFNESSGGHGKLASLAFMLFVLIYTPCVVAIAAERQELGTKWMWFSIVVQLALAWTIGVVVFQGGILLGLG